MLYGKRTIALLIPIVVAALAAVGAAAGAAVAQSRQAELPDGFDHSSLAPDVLFSGPEGDPVFGVRCATRPGSPAEINRIERELARWRMSRTPEELFVHQLRSVAIPVAFHVVTDGGAGNVSDSAIERQMQVLNAAFSGAGFSFHLRTVTRTDNGAWYRGCGGGSEGAMKRALGVDVRRTLNIYSCKPAGDTLGFAFMPHDLPESDPFHGVVLLHSALPGGSAAPYNLGDTGTHEVGHYLGLFHTFERGCNGQGDAVADTPAERSPAYGCPNGRDTCSGGGPDPIDNFMDYTDDSCMTRFTSLQNTRLREMVARYKPSLGGGGGGGGGDGDGAGGGDGDGGGDAATTPPAAPTDLAASADAGTSIELSSADNAVNESSFELLWRQKDGKSWPSWTLVTLPADARSTTVRGLRDGLLTRFALRARNGAGVSEWVRLTVVPAPPEVPSKLTGTQTSPTRIDLSWNDNAANESGFDLRWKTRGSAWQKEMLRADKTDEPLRFLEKGRRYRIILRAVNGGGASPWRRISLKLE